LAAAPCIYLRICWSTNKSNRQLRVNTWSKIGTCR
jgi:hypothetical protein